MLLEKLVVNLDEVFKKKGFGGKLLISSAVTMALGMLVYLRAIFEDGYEQGIEQLSIAWTVVAGLLGAVLGVLLMCFILAFEKGGAYKIIAITFFVLVPTIIVLLILANPVAFHRMFR